MESIQLKPFWFVRCYSVSLATVFVLISPTAKRMALARKPGGSYAECQERDLGAWTDFATEQKVVDCGMSTITTAQVRLAWPGWYDITWYPGNAT